MRTARDRAPASYFLGVRLTSEETALLDTYRDEHQLPNRSAAIRALLREKGVGAAAPVGLPATLRNELDELVEDGYAGDVASAIALVATLGIRELARTHAEHVPALRERARSANERRQGRRRVDREGRGLLGR